MNDFYDVFSIEDLRIIVWSLADRLKTGPFSCPLELFCCQMGYKMYSKALFERLEKNKKIYIKEFSEGS